MTGIGELERLTDEESADLNGRLERFRAAWQADGTTSLEQYLPPRGKRHRAAVLLQLVLLDMQLRATNRLPFECESYLTAYQDDISVAAVPIAMLTTEYQLRQRFADKPAMEEYRRRFPQRYEEFARLVLLQATAGPRDHTPVTAIPQLTKAPSSHTVDDGRKAGAVSPPPIPTSSHIGELAGTGPVDFREQPRLSGGSTILPTGTPYQLIRKLGSGAFGEVYEAFAPGGVRVAVKRILRTVDHPASKAERDALDAIKELSHPFLLKTNAYWVFDDRLVIVMELAEGSLSDRIEYHVSQGRIGIPPEELIPLFGQASDALDYLHSQNVSHRDIKPENILILRGYAKVGDFGLARIHEHTMTMVNNTVGTPAYMAPEMWKQKVSLQSDQYSLAATYIRARLNRHLFTTNILVDLANFHINEMPNLDPLPLAEQKVLLKALAKEPRDRYESCVEFAQALRAAVMPAPEPPKQLVQKEGIGGALGRALLIALACALVVGAVNYFTRKSDTPPVVEEKRIIEEKKEPEKRYATYPDFWKPVEEKGSEFIGDKYYHNTLMRKVGDRELIAHLIYPTAVSHPKPFYMLEHKITNKVFNKVWSEISNGMTVKELEKGKPHLIIKRWLKDEDDNPLDIDNADADVPVMGVTVVEALLVAEWLSGTLPTFDQWLKATGLREDNAENGPAGGALMTMEEYNKAHKNDNPENYYNWLRKQFTDRNVALGLREKPLLPVTSPKAAGDLCDRWKIRQLVSNGQEWLCHGRNVNSRVSLSLLDGGEQQIRIVSRRGRDVIFDKIIDLKYAIRTQSWVDVTGESMAGFRIVLEPR